MATTQLFIPPSTFGISSSRPIQTLARAIPLGAGTGRTTVAFVNNGFQGGDIDKVINNVAGQARSAGAVVEILGQDIDLATTCRSSIRGVSACFGAAVFYGSPTEGPGGIWNYSLRADGGLGVKIDVTSDVNDVEVYPLPLQHAVDFAIANLNTTVDHAALPSTVDEFIYTSLTPQERNDNIRVRYMGGIIQILAVAFFIGIVGVIYQMVGLLASERELGMTQIIEASMPNVRRWEPQFIRLLACHIAFDIMFLPGWIIIGIILGVGVFAKTNMAILIIYNILTGLSLASFSIFGAAFFHKAQLSGIVTTIVSLLLAVLAQVVGSASTGAVAVLSLLFPPMNYTFFTILMARWEQQDVPTNLVQAAPTNPSTLPGIVFFVFLIIQIVVFPILGAWVERYLYGTASSGRRLTTGTEALQTAVRLSSFTKEYRPSWWARNVAVRFGKRKENVIAVNNLDLDIRKGQIMVLLGANGSGKSTTLEAVAGLNTVTSGTVEVDGFGGIGICPQKNVLWDNLTAFEHVRIFNRLKSTETPSSKSELESLIKDCDLDLKIGARSGTLSGGQKRKLQLAMMFTGGSRVCCVDECSSGVDALARQKLWNILMSERGKRTIIYTTHFLDEADVLADDMAILSKGNLKAQGSSVELKHRLGGGFRVHVYLKELHAPLPVFDDVSARQLEDQVIYTLPDSSRTADFVERLDQHGITNYEITSPTVEEIFFNIAESLDSSDHPDVIGEIPSNSAAGSGKSNKESSDGEQVQGLKALGGNEAVLKLQTGKPIGVMRQAWSLFRKRYTVFQRNYLPYAAAFLLPVIAAGLVTLFLKGFQAPGCTPSQQISPSDISSLLSQVNYDIVIGPQSRLNAQSLLQIEATLPGGNATAGGGSGVSNLISSLHYVDTLDEFHTYINTHFGNVTPGGFFLGDAGSPPIFAFQGDADISFATITQNLFDTLLTNVSIASQFQAFDVPWVPGVGNTLQLIVYFGLAMCAYPAFFALYPTLERLRSVRQLHYSNGVRSVCLWSAYLAFDFVIVLATSVLAIIIFRAVSDAWYGLGYLFLVLFLYGIASTLLSYVISLFARSQLAAFAFAAGGQAVMFLLYFIAYLSVLTYSATNKVDSNLLIAHFTIALITPAGNLIRALFVALNIFATTCLDTSVIASNPGDIRLYGGPILYLIGQSLFLFGILLWWDSGSIWARIRRKKYRTPDGEESAPLEDEIVQEVKRVEHSVDDGLRVQHITKAFGSNVAVQDITFGVKRGEVFALLGPNGAGKSTTISLIRGDINPSNDSGDIYVEDCAVSKRRAAARIHLGVCPQVDACDQMTVLEHLRFYARIRGVDAVEENVVEVVRAVGLGPFQHRMAAKLSGGNKRKLSLAIALMGNPSVLLLDEPSSGMDVLAKRIMWKTLASVTPGRSLVLTTHSMEEADALADRAGIMGKKMLALGTSQELRRKHGDRYYVHLIMKTAPHTTDDEMEKVKEWITLNLDGADVEDKTYHGQLRFSVPAGAAASRLAAEDFSKTELLSDEEKAKEREKLGTLDLDLNNEILVDSGNDNLEKKSSSTRQQPSSSSSGIGALFSQLEAHKTQLGFEYYSVSPTTLDQVFLTM